MPERRYSKQRDAILKLIQSTEIHPGARWVYDQLKPKLPELSLGTVYRNIKILCEEGMLNSIAVVNGEERFDWVSGPHFHAVCGRCGKVLDLPKKADTEIFDRVSGEIPGFSIDIGKTLFYGLCSTCKSKKTTALGR